MHLMFSLQLGCWCLAFCAADVWFPSGTRKTVRPSENKIKTQLKAEKYSFCIPTDKENLKI